VPNFRTGVRHGAAVPYSYAMRWAMLPGDLLQWLSLDQKNGTLVVVECDGNVPGVPRSFVASNPREARSLSSLFLLPRSEKISSGRRTVDERVLVRGDVLAEAQEEICAGR